MKPFQRVALWKSEEKPGPSMASVLSRTRRAARRAIAMVKKAPIMVTVMAPRGRLAISARTRVSTRRAGKNTQ